MALTKAEMAERLFEEVGLNKREAKEFVDLFFDAFVNRSNKAAASNCPVSETSTCAKKISARGVTQKPAKKFQYPRGVS